MKTIDWVKTLESTTGGILDRPGGSPYPEVSGYLVPTLFDHGEGELAGRIAEWLLTVQRPDGSFPDQKGISRAFDTSACMEGLERAFVELNDSKYEQAARRAGDWIRKLEGEDGSIITLPGHDHSHMYTMRASWLINSKKVPTTG